jgi:hypothetical protein
MHDRKLFFTEIFETLICPDSKIQKHDKIDCENLKEVDCISEWEQEYEVIYKSYVID